MRSSARNTARKLGRAAAYYDVAPYSNRALARVWDRAKIATPPDVIYVHSRPGIVRELRRVARGPVVIVTYDPEICAQMWLYRDYLPEAAALDRATFPPIDELTKWLGGSVSVEPLLNSRDTPDWTVGSFWAHPERVLDEAARSATSAFARMEPAVLNRVVAAVDRDLRDGAWDRRNGGLRGRTEYDVGMRLLVAQP